MKTTAATGDQRECEMKSSIAEGYRLLHEFNQPADKGLSESFSSNHQVVGSLHMSWKPPMDVFYSKDDLVVMMDIAGVEESQLYLSFQNQRLEIRGIRREQGRYPDRDFHQLEINFGPFQRSVVVPSTAIKEKIKARYSDGFLEIVIPLSGKDDRQVLELD